MTANLWHTVGTLLSMALLTSGGGSHPAWITGEQDYVVAQAQAQLGVLGFDPGPLTGRLTDRFWHSADLYASTFGLQPSQNFTRQLSRTVTEMGTIPQSAGGPVIWAVEQDLKILGLYAGALNSRWSASLAHAVIALQQHVDLPPTGVLTADTLTELAHLSAVSVTANHHWTYHAQPGDTLSTLAFAAHLPYPGFARANNAHGSELLVGQLVHWATQAVPHRKNIDKGTHKHLGTTPPRSAPSPQPTPSAGESVGVLANLKPLADLVLVNPDAAEASALVSAEGTVADRIDVAVQGQWALTHPSLVKELSQLGNGLAIDGYSGTNLNLLPAWGVRQELSWSRDVIKSETGTVPSFLFTLTDPDSTVVTAASQSGLIPVVADDTVTGSWAHTTTLSVAAALLSHAEQTVAVSAPVDWSELFQYLSRRQFVFETLGQIWAGQ